MKQSYGNLSSCRLLALLFLLQAGCGWGPSETRALSPTPPFPTRQTIDFERADHRLAEQIRAKYGNIEVMKTVFGDTIPWDPSLLGKDANLEKSTMRKGGRAKYFSDVDLTQKKEIRDAVMRELIWLADYDYDRFRATLVDSKAFKDVVADFTSIGLTTASTLSGGGETVKSVLSGLATAVTGSSLSLDKNLLADQASFVLVQKMDQQRAAHREIMRQGMNSTIEGYDISVALTDIYVYYQKGSLSTALYEISETTSGLINQQKRENSIRRLLVAVNSSNHAEAASLFLGLPDDVKDNVTAQFPDMVKSIKDISLP